MLNAHDDPQSAAEFALADLAAELETPPQPGVDQ